MLAGWRPLDVTKVTFLKGLNRGFVMKGTYGAGNSQFVEVRFGPLSTNY